MSPLSIGLKAFQTLLRFLEFAMSVVILGIFAHFINTLRSRSLHVPTWVRAVEGLAVAAALYTLFCLLLVWFLGGFIATTAFAVFLDICFIGASIYIATANRGGRHSCTGANVRTPYGTGDGNANTVTDPQGAVQRVTRFSLACRLERVCLAFAIISAVFFLLSAVLEILMMLNRRREKRNAAYGGGDGITDGHQKNGGAAVGAGAGAGGVGKKFFGRGRQQQQQQQNGGGTYGGVNGHHANGGGGYANTANPNAGYAGQQGGGVTGVGGGGGYNTTANPNTLPAHTQPGQLRDSYGTTDTAGGAAGGAGGGLRPAPHPDTVPLHPSGAGNVANTYAQPQAQY
ncbi:hypothetical protein SPI_05605 [Niveomyces insectorum RCEF 264]|uniref:MARVEL domain-containing protein n=1 Tax=Niveomyces insectorum RCEF 264 TaxID=1081102 RepID=A0A167TD78_9HYPO|nr:hypothetical protein SPI_05605 [Niveomyces insectorum RCEF 264]